MLGQLVFDGGRGGPRRALLYGLPVLRCQADPEGFLGERRLKRAGRSLCAGGAVRALVPAGFDRWPLLLKLGLRPVDPGAFLRAQAAPLAASLLERQGLAPGPGHGGPAGPSGGRGDAPGRPGPVPPGCGG